MNISHLLAHFRNPQVNVTLDPLLLAHLDCPDKVTLVRTVPINLYRLVLMIGTIQTRRFGVSRRMKFKDKSDLLEMLHMPHQEFRVQIDRIRAEQSPEVLTSVSEDFGVGISIMIAAHLFHIRESTVERIRDTKKRPDWQCQTMDDRLVVVESKGASNAATSAGQRANAILQKNTRQADIRIASLTLLQEHAMTSNNFIDPPNEPSGIDPVLQRNILRAGHYASAFSFFGHVALSRYFSQMRKRIMATITSQEQLEKDETFFEIRNRYEQVHYKGGTYAGTFQQTGENQYIFIGVDINLVSYQGFLNFREYEADQDEQVGDNHYVLFRDGILLIEIGNIQDFADVVRIGSIRNFQEFITISDIDAMNEISFEKYWVYLLNRTGFLSRSEVRGSDRIVDITATRDGRRYIFELKLFTRRRIGLAPFAELVEGLRGQEAYRSVLVSNAELPDSNEPNVIFIGRSKLIAIIRNPALLRELLEGG